ncbi:Location of vulva defective 1 [Armadillidium vulgare]|nr:Location of vulva defective 1 [Armadillidium vulgare]
MPPNCGKCELYPPKGEDRYPVFCNNPNWIDPEGMGISSYTYYYLENSPNGQIKKTIVSTIKHSLELILPVGTYELLVEISDVLGATTNHSIGVVNITTTKDPDPESWMDLAAKDKTELWMRLMQFSSIRDASKNYSLNPEDIANMTEEEIEGRIREIANLNTLASGLLSNTSSLATMKDINAVTSILRCLMDPVYKDKLSSQTWDMNGIDNVMELLSKINSTIPKLNVSSPGEYLPFMPQYLDIMGAAMISLGNNMDERTFCPPTDMDFAPFMQYDLGAISEDTEIPDNQDDMYCNTVKDSIKYKALTQVKDMESSLDIRLDEISEISVPGETFRCTSPNGVSLVLSKIMELVLKGGLNITAKFSSKAGVMFPANFCPSMYKIPDTDCNQVLAIKCIVWPCITHMYPDTTKILSKSTKILDLDIIINKDRVDVKNESNPIRMNIPRELDTTPQYNNVNASLELNRHVPFVYHSFNVTYEKSSITIEIRSLGPQEDLYNVVLLLDHNDTMPTPTKYWKIKKVQELEKDENDTYKYFISSDENENRTGRFFAAIAKLDKSFENVPDIENLTFSKSDFVKDFDLIYSFSAYTSGCYFFDDLAMEWSGRDLYVESASPDNIQCATHHLTPFGFGFTPTINSVDFEFIFSNAGFMDNLTIYIVLIVLGCLFIFMIIWAFFKDRKDIERRGVIPLPDNKPEDKYLYELSFRTGPDDQASTDSNIYIIVSGECGETEVRVLPPANNRLYRRFEVNTFVMTTPKPLGKLNYLRVFHDNSGEPPLDGWQLEMVVVRDLQLHEKYIFDINDWLAFYRSDGKIDKTFTVYEGKDEKTFTQNMYVRGNRAANEDHMWFSIFLRSNGSRYDRKERVTVSFAFLFLSMLVDAVWYDMTKESAREGNFNLGPFTFSLEQLLTGLCIVCVIFPVMYLVTLIFKRARPRNLKKCRAIESIQEQRAEQRNMEKETAFEDEKVRVQIDEGRPPKPKDVSQIKCIPWWTRLFAWIFVIASIGVSAFFVWSYGILWNETKTAQWFSSFILTFFLSILVAQWVKVAVISLISATCCKEDLTVQDIDCDEELPVLKQNEEWQYPRQLDPTMRKKVHRVIGVDIENKETKSIQERMQKEYQIGHVLRGILIYCIFLAIVLTLVNGRTDYNAFLFQQHMTQVFIKDGVLDYDFEAKVKTSNEYWLWAKSILSELRAQDWYNGAPPYGLRGFLNDRASRIMGYPIIRQVRTKRYKCEVPSPVDTEITHCSGVRSPFREEEQSFCVGWIFNETFPGSCDWEEFQHKTAGELGTYPYTGKLGVYGGGGYIIRLNGYQADLSNRLDQLQQNNWIDKNTRAVFLEFSVYNANVNLFCMCTVLCEFIDGGGLMPKWRFEPVRLIKDTGVKGLITTICELGFAAATIFFTFRELWEIKKMKLKYFVSYWNLAEMCIVIISYLAIGMYIYRTILTQEALDKFNTTNGNGYVRMDSAAFVDQVFVYAAAAVVFFSTIKLIKLLQFNNRFNMLGLTIRGCWEDLKMFFVAFAIIFFAFSCLFFFMFTAHLEEFAKIISAIQTSFQMMMGKFEFEAMKNINFFSPLLFFVFSVINSMILINVMLTIILQAFADVKMDLANRQNRLDVINHVWISFKRFIRKEQLPKINVQPNFNDKEDGRYGGQYGERKSDNLPDKVSMLLKYINDVYFDGRLDLNDPYAKKALMSGTMSEKMLHSMTQPLLAKEPSRIAKSNNKIK